MLPGMDALPSLNMSGGDAYGGSLEFGGVHFNAPASQRANNGQLLIIAGVAFAAYYFLRR